jgi:cold shock protein
LRLLFLLFSLLAGSGPVTGAATEGKNEMTTGTVKFFNENKGYGFIAPDGGGNDAFVHMTAVERAGMRSLRQNQRVSYDLQQDNRGKTSAVNLKVAEEATQPEAISREAGVQPGNDQQAE